MSRLARAGILLLILALLLAGAHYSYFADECDNMLGGKIIASGGTLYQAYWSHHMPLIYQVSGVFYTLGARSYQDFRLMYAVLVWLCGLALYGYLRDDFVLFLGVIFAAVAPIMQNNQITAEAGIGYLLVAAFLLLDEDNPRLLPVIVLLLWLIPAAGLKQVYLAAALFLLTYWRFRRAWRWMAVSLIAPAALTALYFLVYGNFTPFLHQAYAFNRDIYSQFTNHLTAPGDVLLSQLVGFVQSLANFQQGYDAPMMLVLPFVAALLVVSLAQRYWWLSAVFVTLLLLSHPGEGAFNPYTHFTAFYMALVMLDAYSVWWLWQRDQPRLLKQITAALFVLALLPGFLWNTRNTVARPTPYADALNQLAQPGETVYIAPTMFCEWLATDHPNAAAPYYLVYAWTLADPQFHDGLLSALEAHPPAVMVYDPQAYAWNRAWTMPNIAPEIDRWVRANYREVQANVWILDLHS